MDSCGTCCPTSSGTFRQLWICAMVTSRNLIEHHKAALQCTIWQINIDPENGIFEMELIFQSLSGRVYVNLPEGNSDVAHSVHAV